jgi:glycosyltransferase involved in cell wall biosynthesis
VKVALLWKALVVGDYQRKPQEIARAIDGSVLAITPSVWKEPGSPVRLERLHTEGYDLVVSPLLFNGNFHLCFFPYLSNLLDANEPDLIHVDEEPYNLMTFLAVREARRRKIPALFFTWQNLVRRYPPPFSWMEKYVYRHAAAAIAGTDAAARVLREKGYRGSITVIPQVGVDPDVYRPAPADEAAPARPFTIGFAGRLVPEKGLDVLLRAASQLDVGCRVIIAGAGPERPKLENLARDLKITDRVEFRGSLPSSSMPELMSQLDVLTLPSLSRPNWTEQFGRVLPQAMSCGIPVLGSTCGEIPEVIGDAGLIFPEGDVRALTEQLRRLHADPKLRRDLARQGRERVLERFTHERIARETAAVYTGLTSATAPAQSS